MIHTSQKSLPFKIVAVLFIGLILSACAGLDYQDQNLTPLDQAKLNTKIYNLRLKCINSAISDQFNETRLKLITTENKTLLLYQFKMQQEIDTKLSQANKLLHDYIVNVDKWEKSGTMPIAVVSDEQQLHTLILEIVATLENSKITDLKEKIEKIH